MKRLILAFIIIGLAPLSGYGSVFSYSRTVTVNHAQIANTDQANFPVYVSLTDPSLRTVANGGHVQSNTGADITFFSDAGLSQLLNYELVTYDGVAGTVNAAVQIPLLSHTTDTVFFIGYGSTTLTTSNGNPGAVWANYLGVYHFEDRNASNVVLNSAVASGIGNATAVNTTMGESASGANGFGLTFNGSSDSVDLGSYSQISGATRLTYSGWVKFNSLSDYAQLIGKVNFNSGAGSLVSLSGQYNVGSPNSDWFAAVRPNWSAFNWTTQGYHIQVGTWYYFNFVFSNPTAGIQSVILYVNGIPVISSGLAQSPVPSVSTDLLVGSGTAKLNGTMDEVRVSLNAFSADWIATEYRNLSSPVTFAGISSEISYLAQNAAIPFTVKTVGTTPTQAILSYTAPDTNACTVAVSDSSVTNTFTGAYLGLIHDVDPVLFPGSNQDTRPTSSVNGTLRTIVIGSRSVGDAVDGKTYSRALQANTPHFYTISCGNGRFVSTGSFTTQNIPVGNSAPDPIQYDSSQWGAWGWPTINYSDKSVKYVDPQTGALLRRITGPGDEGNYTRNLPISRSVDLSGGGWQGTSNVGFTNDQNYASYSGAGGPGNAMFLWGQLAYYRASFIPTAWTLIDDVQLNLNGFGDQTNAIDRTVTGCLSPDYGQTCVGSTVDFVLPQGATASVTGPNPWPVPLLQGWGDAHITADMLTNNFQGTLASVSGSTVTWGNNQSSGSNVYFPVTSLKQGDRVLISGTDPICPQNACTIASITNEFSLTIQQNVGSWSPLFTNITAAINVNDTSFTVSAINGIVQTALGQYIVTVESDTVSCTALNGNTFSSCSRFPHAHSNGAAAGQNQYLFPNFGFKLWKKTSIGTVRIDSAQTNWATSASMYTDYQGAGAPYCSSQTVNATYAADGVTPIAALPGYVCIFNSSWGNPNLYFFAPSTGESRYLSTLFGLAPSLGGSPTQFYVFDGSRHVLQSCTYNANDAVNGRFKAFDDGRNLNFKNPAIQCSDLNPPGYDVKTEIAAACPQIDQTYFGDPAYQSGGYPLVEFMSRPSQGAMAWFEILDLSKPPGASQVIKCHNDWDTYPIRWLSSHGNEYLASGGYAFMDAQVVANAPGVAAEERWDLNINRIYNNGSTTALPANFLDPQTCEQLGVTDQRWITQGATGSHCVKINVANEPVATSPSPADLRALGSLPVGSRPTAWPHNVANCGGDGTTSHCWAYLQPLQEGDYLNDSTGGPNDEKFLIAKKTTLSDGTIDLVIARNMTPFGCRASFTQNHSTGWTPIMWPPQSCGIGSYYSLINGPNTAVLIDNPQTYIGHTVAWINPQGNELHVVPYSWNFPYEMGGYGSGFGVRTGLFPGVIGQNFTFGINDIYPFAGDSHGITIGQVQSHPGGITFAASPREANWAVDGRPLGGALGGAQQLWNQDIFKISGFQNVYRLSVPLWSAGGTTLGSGQTGNWDASLARKKRVVTGFAGYHYMRDISGPGSVMDDTQPWTFCIADFAGECRPGSNHGDQFVNVPNASTTGICANDGTINTPCLSTFGPEVGAFQQMALDRPDPFGLRWRKLTSMFNGPGRTDNYANMHPLATADWAVSPVRWADGRRSDIFGVKLPPWPNEDSLARNTFVNIAVSLGSQPGSSVRARFGYDGNLFCSTRQEQCSTAVSNTDPYAWVSEPQTWTACSVGTGCKINIPAISGRVLYYVVDRQNASGTVTSGPLMMTTVR